LKKSVGLLSISGVSVVACIMLCTEGSQILGATVQNEATCVALSWSVTVAPRNVGKCVQFINIDSSCLIVVVLCFTEVNQLLVE
jgi:hypothetical protein